jgi:hypothetical protein
MNRLIAIGAFFVCWASSSVEAKLRLVAKAPTPYAITGQALLLDLYLHNDGAGSVTLPALRFASATWSVIDPSNRRSPEAGSSRAVSDHGTEQIVVAARSVAHERIKLFVAAQNGDVVKVTVRLGKDNSIESKPVTFHFTSAKTR